MATKSKKVAKKRSNSKNKAPPKLALARTIKKPERLADFVELDDAAFEKRVEAFMRDTTTLDAQAVRRARARPCLFPFESSFRWPREVREGGSSAFLFGESRE